MGVPSFISSKPHHYHIPTTETRTEQESNARKIEISSLDIIVDSNNCIQMLAPLPVKAVYISILLLMRLLYLEAELVAETALAA